MATKGHSGGLLAKMAQLMGASKSASRDPEDSQQSVQSTTSELERIELQERIEGKRRDDQIRRMEFNHLRKLRGHDKAALGALPRNTGYEDSSGYADPRPSVARRERTVDKINAIEAHLTDHWGQRQSRHASDTRAATPAAAPAQSPPAPAAAARRPAPVEPAPARADVVANAPPLPKPGSADPDSDMDLDFVTYLASAPVPLAVEPAQPVKDPGHSGYPDSRIESVELGQMLDNPALQDAALRFADGDDAGAEGILVAAMQDTATDAQHAEDCAAALLDLYRATDQAMAFDVVAIEYAERFGRSAPEWYSVPALLEVHKSAATATRDASGLTQWICPAVLDARAVADLRTAQPKSVERHVQWEQVQRIEPEAVPALAALFSWWATQPLALSFRGHEALNALLLEATVQGDKQVDSAWWTCRLDALRLQGEHEAFENAAVDYCVTYEVSPPSWVEADCTFTKARVQEDGPESTHGPDSVYSTFGDSMLPDALELSGTLRNDISQLMQGLGESVPYGDAVVVSCTRLVRIDFSAAGSLLNWLAARPAKAGMVEFVNVPRLVATLFTVMGISEHALVVSRQR